MHILHVALGGCLTYPDVRYGITDDTGGHIAYVLGAARAQVRRPDVTRVDVVTRAFDDPSLGPDHAHLEQRIDAKMRILRLATDDPRYLSKEALAADRAALARAFRALVDAMPMPPDVIHVHFADAAAIVRETVGAYGIPLVYTPHSLGIDKASCQSGSSRPALQARIDEERAALTQADGIIVSSRDEAERQVEGYGVDVAARTHRIAPGVTHPRDTEGTQAARDLVDADLHAPDRPMVLAIARPVHKKNLVALMRAYLDTPGLRDRANLVILAGQRGAGIAQEPETRAVIDELEHLALACAGAIALPERHAPDVVPQLYRLAAERGGVFVNPALHEPFGLTLLEAAQAGLPVVATRAGGPVDILGTLGNGTLVDPTDTAAIGTAISALLSDPAAWAAAADAGRSGIHAFDWDVWAARAQRVYTDLHRAPRRFAAPRRLLACDIDGTLTGCRDGAAAFAAWDATRDMPFIVATGRSITEARHVLADWDLPEPDAFVTAVGTELHRRAGTGRLALCSAYANEVARDWDRAATLDALAKAGADLQPPVEQRRWKLACFGTQAEADRLRDVLLAAGLRARIVASHGHLIDVLAPHGGKAAAIGAYARTLGLTAADCIVAGDSGNDLDMLTGGGHGIVVGNALPELDGLLARPRLLRTRAHHAAGVLEGLHAVRATPLAASA